MISTSAKIAIGFTLLVVLLLGTVGYIYREMNLLTEPSEVESGIKQRRLLAHQLISRLYDAEVIGQSLHSGKFDEYEVYVNAMNQAGDLLDSLQTLLTDSLQQDRLDTLKALLFEKKQNMQAVLEAVAATPADQMYESELDSFLHRQDSLLREARVQKKVVTHRNSYTIRHKKKGFFKRLAEVFVPSKSDSTQVNNLTKEEFTDTLQGAYNPADTLASILANIRGRVSSSQQQQQRILIERINKLRIAGSKLSQRVTQLLDTIESEEREAMVSKMSQEQSIRDQAAHTIEAIASLGVILSIVLFVIIWRDLTRSSHYRRELEKSNRYAENLLAAREQLMLTITHDIKAPAGSIIGYIDLLIRLVSDRRQRLYLTNMKSSARHLLDLVTSLLDYHRLEAGKMDLQQVTFHPNELFEEVYNSFLPLTQKKGIKLTLHTQLTDELTLEGDPFRIRQIVENLLSNALKFTHEGSIVLRADYQQNRLVFSVQDTGCGMTVEEQQRIFKEFTRLQSAQGQEGFGLGLSISKKLVELAQGSIDVSSTPQQGSTFTVSLPLPQLSTENLPVGKVGKMLQTDHLRILVVDDDSIQLNLTQTLFQHTLSSVGMNSKESIVIYPCQHPSEVWQTLQSHPIDILFTDIQMPEMNGFELLRHIRQKEDGQAAALPVIAITARGDLTEKDFLDQGFSGMLQKPFSQAEVLQLFARFFPLKETQSAVPETQSPKPDASAQQGTFRFDQLLAFSEDDTDAAMEILQTFIQETQKHISSLKQALEENNLKQLCHIAHKMLPTFTLIDAREILPVLRELERRDKKIYLEEGKQATKRIIACAQKAIEQAEKYGQFLQKNKNQSQK